MRTLLSLLFFTISPLVSCVLHSIHERREVPLQDALDRQRLDGEVVLPMRISLRQNEDAVLNGEAWLMAVADPEFAQYGRHWSQEEVHKAFEPSEETLNAVTAWLSEHGIDHHTRSDNRQWLVFEIRVSEAENLLQTQFFEHRDSNGRFKVSCDEYSLPSLLREHIDFVSPGVVVRDITGLTQRSREYLSSGMIPSLILSALLARDVPTASRALLAVLPLYESLLTNQAPAVQQNTPSPYPSPETPPYPLRERGVSSLSTSHQPYPTASFPKRRPPFAPDDLSHCYRAVSPACIRALYGFDIANPNEPVSENNSMGIFEHMSLTLQGDLNKFFEYYTDIPPYTAPTYDSIDGAIVQPNQTRGWRKKYDASGNYTLPWPLILGESTLDLQLAFPIVWPQTVTVFQADDWYWESHLSIRWGLFNEFFDGIDGSYCTYTAFNDSKANSTLYHGYPLYPSYPDPRPHGYKGKVQCGAFKPTNVISISYAVPELYVSWLWQKRQCLEFLKLGLQGVSTFVASGDEGVGFCYPGPIGDRLFNPFSPAACPWVTSVGGTQIHQNRSVYAPEVAVHGAYYHSGWSGGGFSIVYDRPSYQEQAVSSYFSKANLDIPYFTNGQYKNNTGRYNRNGRGFPDVSAVAIDIATVMLGNYSPGSGTSASTPIVASLFNRIIEERIRAGKGPLGFVNPALYKNANALNDILHGNNRGPCSQGFECIKGWDPVTGLGTPNYPKLLDVFLNLP